MIGGEDPIELGIPGAWAAVKKGGPTHHEGFIRRTGCRAPQGFLGGFGAFGRFCIAIPDVFSLCDLRFS